MKKKTKKQLKTLTLIIISLLVIIGIGLWVTEIVTENERHDKEYVLIDEPIKNIEVLEIHKDGRYAIYDYVLLNVTFENNATYIIKFYEESIDLTVNSKLILNLVRNTYDGRPQTDYWMIDTTIKVPEESK